MMTSSALKTRRERREMMTVRELADYLKVSRHTIYQWINDSRFPFAYYKHERAVRFDRRDVDEWLDTGKVTPI